MNSKHLGIVWYGDQWKYFTGFKDTGKNKNVKIKDYIGGLNEPFPIYKIEIDGKWRTTTSLCIKRLPMGATIRVIGEEYGE